MEQLDSTFLAYAGGILAETSSGLTGKTMNNIVTKYVIENKVSMTYCPENMTSKVNQFNGYLNEFDIEDQVNLIYKMCNEKYQIKRDEVKRLKSILLERYGEFIDDENDNLQEIINETKHWLEDYPQSKNLYERALSNSDDRNMIDDLRLSLELLCKRILNNDKSLENNKIKLLKLLSLKNTHQDIVNLFEKVFESYYDYNNHNIKHNDDANNNENSFLIEITSSLMKFLIKQLR